MLKRSLFLLALAFFSTSIHAQKMNIIDYFNAFLSNTASPNNNLKKLGYTLSPKGANYILSSELLEDDEPINIEVNANKTYLAFKDALGWKGYECKPIFKIFTKADGTEILAITEDATNYYSHISKYKPKESDEAYEDWSIVPKPIKFWTYKNNTWTEVTNEVMPKFFSFEDMIASTKYDLAGLSLKEFAKEYLSRYTHPIYTMDSNSQQIKVWIEDTRLKQFIKDTGVENPAVVIERMSDDLSKDYYAFLEDGKTQYNTYTLVWDANKGQFVRK